MWTLRVQELSDEQGQVGEIVSARLCVRLPPSPPKKADAGLLEPAAEFLRGLVRMMTHEQDQQAAARIQRVWRGHRGRLDLDAKARAAATLAARQRGIVARRETQQKRNENRAAATITAGRRGVVGRRRTQGMRRELAEREEAATRLQATEQGSPLSSSPESVDSPPASLSRFCSMLRAS